MTNSSPFICDRGGKRPKMRNADQSELGPKVEEPISGLGNEIDDGDDGDDDRDAKTIEAMTIRKRRRSRNKRRRSLQTDVIRWTDVIR